ncbi:MAG: ABC transporter substrate-binding protein [Candidatus Hodarchaeales archaeon]|jgi:branched-chain amino acid transport system substrate-binding protein
MKKIRTILLLLVIIGMTFSLFLGTGTVQAAREKVKIGALGPLAILPGIDMQNGVNLAVEEINKDGFTVGSTDYDFEVITETTSGDDGLPDPATGSTSLSKLIDDDQVTAIIGGFRTEVVSQLQANLGTTPFLGVGSTATKTSDYFWRVGPPNGTQLVLALVELYTVFMPQKGVVNVTIVREDATWTGAAGVGGGVKAYVPPTSVNFTDDIVISPSATPADVEGALTPTKTADVQALLTIFSGPVGKKVTEAWASLDMPQMLAGINVESQRSTFFADTAGAAYGEIELETAPPDIETTTKTAAFRTAYTEKYGEAPTYTAYASYDAVYVLKEALVNGGSLDSADIQTAMLAINYEGAGFWVKFTSDSHDLWTPATFGATGGVRGTVDGKWYVNPVFAQWQKNGVKKTVYLHETFTPVVDFTNLEWPINHTDFGTIPTSEEEDAGTPGYELPIVVLILGSMAVISNIRKRKKL